MPSTFIAVLDMDAGTLGFIADGQWLGTAFKGLNKPIKSRNPNSENLSCSEEQAVLYPIVSCVWGHCEVQMKYINGLTAAPLTLKVFFIFFILSNTENSQNNDISVKPDLKRCHFVGFGYFF